MATGRRPGGRSRTPGPKRVPGKSDFVWSGAQPARGLVPVAAAAPAVLGRLAASGPKVLLYDVECFPNLSWTWGTFEQNVIKVHRPRMLCSISWQWYPSTETHVLALPDFDDYDQKAWAAGRWIQDASLWNNRRLIEAFSLEMQKADVVVGHNVALFDDRRLNTDVARLKLQATPRHRAIDTLQVLRRRFDFNSNRLDSICQELGIGRKLPHPGFEMWERCIFGDMKAWSLMKRYNRHDVSPLLRGLYEFLRPWVPNHPNGNVGAGTNNCPTCGSKNLRSDGWRYTQTKRYQRLRCKDCLAPAQGVLVRNALEIRPI
jgi:hypothetical protein